MRKVFKLLLGVGSGCARLKCHQLSVHIQQHNFILLCLFLILKLISERPHHFQQPQLSTVIGKGNFQLLEGWVFVFYCPFLAATALISGCSG